MIPYCILAIENEDDRAFMEGLYRNYHKLMYSEIIKITRNQSDAEDIMQSVLEKFIDKIPELRVKDRDRLVNYIIVSCRNRSYNFLRDSRQSRMVQYEDCIDAPDDKYDRHQMDFSLIKDEELRSLSRIWPKLDERSRHLLEGYYILEKSMPQLGEELGIKPSSVRMTLTRARKKAFELLEKELGEDEA